MSRYNIFKQDVSDSSSFRLQSQSHSYNFQSTVKNQPQQTVKIQPQQTVKIQPQQTTIKNQPTQPPKPQQQTIKNQPTQQQQPQTVKNQPTFKITNLPEHKINVEKDIDDDTFSYLSSELFDKQRPVIKVNESNANVKVQPKYSESEAFKMTVKRHSNNKPIDKIHLNSDSETFNINRNNKPINNIHLNSDSETFKPNIKNQPNKPINNIHLNSDSETFKKSREEALPHSPSGWGNFSSIGQPIIKRKQFIDIKTYEGEEVFLKELDEMQIKIKNKNLANKNNVKMQKLLDTEPVKYVNITAIEYPKYDHNKNLFELKVKKKREIAKEIVDDQPRFSLPFNNFINLTNIEEIKNEFQLPSNINEYHVIDKYDYNKIRYGTLLYIIYNDDVDVKQKYKLKLEKDIIIKCNYDHVVEILFYVNLVKNANRKLIYLVFDHIKKIYVKQITTL
jgi:hypothetical protein